MTLQSVVRASGRWGKLCHGKMASHWRENERDPSERVKLQGEGQRVLSIGIRSRESLEKKQLSVNLVEKGVMSDRSVMKGVKKTGANQMDIIRTEPIVETDNACYRFWC